MDRLEAETIGVARASQEAVLFLCRGYLTAAMTPYVRRYADPMMAKGARVSLFFDMLGVDNYEPAARQTMTAFIKESRASMAGLHVLVRSRLVAIGVAAAN